MLDAANATGPTPISAGIAAHAAATAAASSIHSSESNGCASDTATDANVADAPGNAHSATHAVHPAAGATHSTNASEHRGEYFADYRTAILPAKHRLLGPSYVPAKRLTPRLLHFHSANAYGHDRESADPAIVRQRGGPERGRKPHGLHAKRNTHDDEQWSSIPDAA